MLIAGEKYDSEVTVGDGRYDGRFWAPDGTLFIFELKYCDLGKFAAKRNPVKEVKKMMKMAKKAMKQIENKNYTKPYRGLGYDIYKAALVVGGRTEVYIEFKKEESR
jgi:hypothetical protein